MNVKIQYDTEFMAGVYAHDTLYLNSYSISLSLLTKTLDSESTNIAIERVKCFMHHVLADTVFFGPNDHEKAEMYQLMGTNVTTLPEEPVDQIVGIMLYCKLNAIMQDRMCVTGLSISSVIGDAMCFLFDEDDSLGPLAKEGWWHDPSVQHNTIESETVPENVVKVIPSVWHEYGFVWPEEKSENRSNTVSYPNFKKNEN